MEETNKRKTENDKRGLQQVEGESWTSWLMALLEARTCQGRQRTKKDGRACLPRDQKAITVI